MRYTQGIAIWIEEMVNIGKPWVFGGLIYFDESI